MNKCNYSRTLKGRPNIDTLCSNAIAQSFATAVNTVDVLQQHWREPTINQKSWDNIVKALTAAEHDINFIEETALALPHYPKLVQLSELQKHHSTLKNSAKDC